jgi:transposase-like protein
MNPFDRSDSGHTTNSPPACPACKSSAVSTTAKHPDVNSYWRCERCGEIWNIGRRHDRPSGGFPWR